MFNAIRNTAVAAALIAASLVGAAPASAAFIVYDAGADFSGTENGTGGNPNWSYGQITGLNTATFTKYTVQHNDDLLAGVDLWSNSDGVDPNIALNHTNSDVFCCNITFAPHQIVAGPFNGPTDLRFTAPITGMYVLSGFFKAVQADPSNTFAHGLIFVNGSQIFDSVATFSSTGLNSNVFLTALDKVDFVVSNIGGGNKSTQINAHLVLVPEPASLGLLVAAGLALVGRRRR